jgi:Beta-1,3-glucanase
MANNATLVSGVPNAQLIIDLTETDLPSTTPVYVYIVGLVNSPSSTFYRIDSNGMPQVMSTADNTNLANTFPGQASLPEPAQTAIAANYPSAWADYSIPVTVGSKLTLILGNINTTNIPNLGTGTAAFSGRVYFSIGIPRLPFTVLPHGYIGPVFGNGSGVPGSLTLFDWIEFSYDSGGNFFGNTTQVDQFAIPLTLTGTPVGKPPYPPQGELNATCSTILTAIAGKPSPFGGSDVMVSIPAVATAAYPANLTYLRAISPKTISGASGAGTSLDTYFNRTINDAYTAWQATPLVTYDPATGYYTGVVFPVSGGTITTPSGYPTGSLAFYAGNYATMSALAAAISSGSATLAFCLIGSGSNRITSNDIWQCANSLASGSAAQLNVGKMLAAAFNRGMVEDVNRNVVTSLNDNTCSRMAPSFYTTGTTYNLWSKWFHQYNKNGLAYGFPYDDVCNQAPTLPQPGNTLVASSIQISVGKFYPNQYIPAGSYQLTSTDITVTINATCQTETGLRIQSPALAYTSEAANSIGDITNVNGTLIIGQGNGSTPNPTNLLGQYVPAGSYQLTSTNITVTINASCETEAGTWVQSPPLVYTSQEAANFKDIININGTLTKGL